MSRADAGIAAPRDNQERCKLKLWRGDLLVCRTLPFQLQFSFGDAWVVSGAHNDTEVRGFLFFKHRDPISDHAHVLSTDRGLLVINYDWAQSVIFIQQ